MTILLQYIKADHHSVYTLFAILSCWVVQVHCLFQIIINRVSILMVNRRRAKQLKIVCVVGILCLNATVFCIWIPAKLGVNKTYERINVVWDRIEKVIILIVDAGLNYFFIIVVQKQLVKPGLTKYKPLVKFNLYMILISLAMDCLIIGMLSLKNPLVYLMVSRFLGSPSPQYLANTRTVPSSGIHSQAQD